MIEKEFVSSPRIPDRSAFVKNMMKEIKSPFLGRIEQTKRNVTQKIEEHIIQSAHASSSTKQKTPPSYQSLAFINAASPSQKNICEVPRLFTQSSCEDCNEKPTDTICAEWTLGKSEGSRFGKLEEITQHYNRVFDEKVKFSNGGRYGGDSFKVEEKQVIEEMYNQLGNTHDHTVDFEAIHRFFKECPLFFRIYNIHPDSLQDFLNDSAHHYEAKLTEEQFMNLFLLNNRTIEDYDNYNVKKMNKECILSEQSWKDLKDIFDIFDTFGNQTIQMRKFFKKLKINNQYKYLLNKEVIYFPSINRYYSLKKILFVLEHKLKIAEDHCQWRQIKDMIQDFYHIREPSIDLIEKKDIADGKITVFSNNFMLKDDVIMRMKDIYIKSPKYCDNFVKVSHFVAELYESGETNDYLRNIVRNQPKFTTVKQIAKDMMSHSLKYLDLDEILEWFSIKGFDKESKATAKENKSLSVGSSSDDEEFNKQRRTAQKLKSNIQNIPKKYPKIDSKQEPTVVQKFNLSKKSKLSIRDQKVQMMINQAKNKEKEECSKKFKASAIPSSTNSEKYEEYKAKLSLNKEFILRNLNLNQEKDRILLQYLQVNTKLFQKPKQFVTEPMEDYVFKAEPVPWFVHVNLLQQINSAKKQKLKKQKAENKYKYLKEWKNLPSFLYETAGDSTPLITKTGSCTYLSNEVKMELGSDGKARGKSHVKDIPNFKELQQNFQQKMQKKKQTYKSTVVQEFNLSAAKAKEIPAQRPSSARLPQPKRNIEEQNSNYIGSTLKYESLVKHNQQRKILDEAIREQKLQDQRQRRKEKEVFAKLVRKELKKEQRKQLKSTGMTSKSKREMASSQSFRQEHEMNAIYRRVFERPFLFQNSSSKQNHKQAESKARMVNLKDDDYHYSDEEQQQSQKLIETLYPSQLMHLQNNDNAYEEAYQERQFMSRNSI